MAGTRGATLIHLEISVYWAVYTFITQPKTTINYSKSTIVFYSEQNASLKFEN